jgi:hypothetical protein
MTPVQVKVDFDRVLKGSNIPFFLSKKKKVQTFSFVEFEWARLSEPSPQEYPSHLLGWVPRAA